MKKLIRTLVIVFLFAGVNFNAEADVKLPRIFSSNMVLQQGIDIPFWGWADRGERIEITFAGNTVRTRADAEGKWKLELPEQDYGGPYKVIIKGKNTIELDNVMVGEVWICSGQSNMEWRVEQSNNAEEEVAAVEYPEIRLFTVPKAVSQFPGDDISDGAWEQCTPETVGGFSAVGYFFGRDLYQELQVPVGLIHTSWGGTVAETWISPNSIADDPDFSAKMIELQQMNMESYRQARLDKVKALLGGEIPTQDLGMVDGKPVWAAIDFDDSDWQSIKAPMYWEYQGYVDIDGIGWYRKEVQLDEEATQTELMLHLGKVDDSDITFFNGIEIGRTENKYDENRVYTIDKKYLKTGKNVIAVRVDDTGGNGGIWGDPENQLLVSENEKIVISGDWKFRISKADVSSVNLGPNSYPTLLFNAMINPIVPYGIKGAIWYQGESNADRAKQYQRIFPALITDWRNHWQLGDFPFLFVSLANFTQPPLLPGESDWAELREAQTKTLALPNTGMALAIDIGEADDIHPRNKQDVGKRLALNAFKVAYGKDIVYSGPMYKSVEFTNGKAYVSFAETGSGLEAKDKYGYLKGFSVAGADRVFHWAKAEIVDDKTVVVYSEAVSNPVAVRYGWANNPDDVNLYNREQLPANPFRTDDWPGITK
ncbi:sialate O-acetylesterase [Mariniphaga anaerophila]|uniref:Sialate O-acetylesterase n=1 Tax=Mariniphaga anaerophila TaxID=1484053 RepID=A0A1M4TJN7_9BACT|nr:sialate O-acetylesterase [Mariniphaga anaerophila]SHE44606.1 sialate O-acetylesterase [Mariniphaga anaerophila]